MVEVGPKLLRGLLEVFVLESLAQAPKHGYALLKEMADAFGAEPNRNRLYPLMGRLVRDEYVHEVSDEEGGRTLYALTDKGRDALDAYRRIPNGFRDALDRIWGAGHAGAAAPAAPAPPAAPPAAPAPAPAPAERASRTAGPRIPVRTQAPAGARLPYPCPDARVGLEKDPGTGELTIHLDGCPMGAYEYCPQCPIFKSVEGIRRLVFGL